MSNYLACIRTSKKITCLSPNAKQNSSQKALSRAEPKIYKGPKRRTSKPTKDLENQNHLKRDFGCVKLGI